MLNDSEFALLSGLNDIKAPADDYEERRDIALFEQHFAFGYFALATDGCYAFDLRIRELGEQLLAAFRRNGQQLPHWRGSHKAELNARRGIKDIYKVSHYIRIASDILPNSGGKDLLCESLFPITVPRKRLFKPLTVPSTTCLRRRERFL